MGTSSPKMIVKIVRMPVTTNRAMAPAYGAQERDALERRSRDRRLRLTPAKAAARKPMKVMPIWMTARKRPGSVLSRRTRRAPRRPSSMSWSQAALAERDEGHLGRREDRVEQDQDDDDADLEDGSAHAVGSSRSGSGGLARGSRIRAGTPTASLPAGTSRVTTDPAPVLAPSPDRDRARRASCRRRGSPVADGRLVLARPVVVGGDRARRRR